MRSIRMYFALLMLCLGVLWGGVELAHARIGASISIAWPFVGDSPGNWTGDEGERTEGADIPACGGTRNSHSGAEHYARDLNRVGGTDDGKPIYSGITGRVVVAGWQNGYGSTVVIYDASRRVAIRYAHLRSLTVSYGQNVPLRYHIGYVGNSGTTSPHLHIVAFENIDHFQRNGDPVTPTLCDSDWYACAIYFFC